MLSEDLYVLYNKKANAIHRVQSWAGGRPSMELKTWKTLSGALKALEKLKKPGQECVLEVKKLDVKSISDL